MGSKSKAPPPPDYAAAARAQGVANVQAARATGKLSNPTVVNPLGRRDVTFGYGGDPDRVFVEESLTPLGQQRFDQEQRIVSQVGDVAESGLGRVQDAFAKPFDFQSASDARQQSIDALSSRMEPGLARDREALRTQLINTGFRPGTEGYNRAMERADQQANDARMQAVVQSGGEQDRMVQLATFLRNQPLNEINALRSGSQVSMPQFQAYQGSQVAPAPIFGAAQAQGQADMAAYNAKVGSQNAMMGGLFGLGGSALQGAGAAGGFGALFSDRRLKTNVERIGTHHLGIGLYEYDIFGQREVGVMADEVRQVMPSAVVEGPGGFLMVNYEALNDPLEG